MFVDTHAVHTVGRAGATHATELSAIATGLASVPATAAPEMFGPVAARFLAALAEAAADTARAVTALGDGLTAASDASTGAALAYDEVERRSTARIGR